MKIAAVLATLAVAAGAAWFVLSRRTLPPAATAAALQRYVHAGYRFRCARIHPDVTIALPHVTYSCSPVVPSADHFGYWVSTDRHRITGVQPQG